VARAPLTSTFGSWPLAVVIATVAAVAAMTATAGVCVLASDRVEAADALYGKPARRAGMRAVRAEPAPDATLVTFVPAVSLLSDELRAMSRPMYWSIPVRPLHEAHEVPDSFI